MEQNSLPAIWSSSPCTISYIAKSHSIDKSKRFQFNSIYYKDDPHKPKIKEDPFTRPQIILQQFRKKIKEATKSTHRDLKGKKKKSNGYYEELDKFNTINVKADEVTRRLYSKPKQFISLQHDIYGNRSSFCQESKQNQKISSPWKVSSKLKNLSPNSSANVYITSTPRIDLSRPENFNPGPGTYFIPDQMRQTSLLASHSRSGSLLGSKNKQQFFQQESNSPISKQTSKIMRIKNLRGSPSKVNANINTHEFVLSK